MSFLTIANPLVLLGLVAVALSAGPSRVLGAEPVDPYDAVALNKELIGNEPKAESFKGKTLEVSGGYYGAMRIRDKAGQPVEPESYLVSFTGYAGLGECLHIRSILYDKAELAKLKKGDAIKVQGKVVSVVRDIIVIEAKLVK